MQIIYQYCFSFMKNILLPYAPEAKSQHKLVPCMFENPRKEGLNLRVNTRKAQNEKNEWKGPAFSRFSKMRGNDKFVFPTIFSIYEISF